MHLLDNGRGVRLRSLGVGTPTRDVHMRAIASEVKKTRKRRVRGTSDPPRLLNQLPMMLSPTGPQAVHATVEVGILKIVSSKKTHDTWLFPVRATSGPLNENSGPDLQGMLSNLLESLPKTMKQVPMFPNALLAQFTLAPIDVDPRRAPGAWAGEPKCVRFRNDLLLGHKNGILLREIILFGDLMDTTRSSPS